MSTPATTQTPPDARLGALPLVHRVFGEPRFHTDGDVAAVAFAADGSLWSIDEAGLLRHWAADGKVLGRHFLSDLETLWCFSPDATSARQRQRRPHPVGRRHPVNWSTGSSRRPG